MENMNNQGKRKDQEKFSSQMVMGALGGIIGILIFCLVAALFTGCNTTKKCCDKEHVITEWEGDKQINWYTCKNQSYGFKRTNKTTAQRKSEK